MTENEKAFYQRMAGVVSVESPFTDEELSEPILVRAVEKALSDINKYRPKIVKLYGLTGDPSFRLIRAYTNEFDSESTIPYIDEYNMDVGSVYVYATDWTIEDIESLSPTKSFFSNLVIAYSSMFMANKRRSSDMSGIPFDLKGDSFYSAAEEKVTSILETLANTMNNTL